MKVPKIGQVVYAGQWIYKRLGETKFLIATQCKVFSSADKVIGEMEDLCEECNFDKTEENFIVWEMRRVK